jgi:cobalt transporter subunit CbtB
MTSATRTLSRPQAASRFAPALAALAFGLALFLTTGFAWPSAIHNATHYTRHSLGLPCH